MSPEIGDKAKLIMQTNSIVFIHGHFHAMLNSSQPSVIIYQYNNTINCNKSRQGIFKDLRLVEKQQKGPQNFYGISL